MLDQLACVPPIPPEGPPAPGGPVVPADAHLDQFGDAAELVRLGRDIWYRFAHDPADRWAGSALRLADRMPAAEHRAMRVVPFAAPGYGEWERRVTAVRAAGAGVLRCPTHAPGKSAALDTLAAALRELELAAVAALRRGDLDTSAAGAGSAAAPTAAVPATGAAPTADEAGPTPQSQRLGVPLPEAEIRVGEWLTRHAKADPSAVTRDRVAAETGVSRGQVSKTAAWKAFSARRDADKRPASREIPLSDRMEAVLPAGSGGKAASEQRDALLNELIRDQEADAAEDAAGHDPRRRRRHGPS